MGDNKVVSALLLASLGYALYQQGARVYEDIKAASQLPEITYGLPTAFQIEDVEAAVASSRRWTTRRSV